VEIDDSKKGMVLKNFGIIGLPHNAIIEGTIKEMDIVASAIKDLFKNLKIKNKNVATSISGYSVIVKKIGISKREDSELESTIQDEAEQYIPFDISDVNLDYEILSTKVTEEEKKEEETKEEGGLMEVMLVAAKKDIVDDYVSLLGLSRLNPIVLDVDAFAIQNAYEVSAGQSSGCYAIVNVGAEELGINAVKDGISIFTRDSSYGGAQITEAIMSKFDLPYHEAEKIKLGGSDLEKMKGDLEEIFTSAVSGWVQEIKRALDFLSTTYPDETIEKLLICGGSCRIPGFKKYLEMETDIPVEELNPFAGLQINEKAFDPKYLSYMGPQAAVAVGLALRSIGDK
jgi:type IV pilus assembly protein PilM